MLDPLATSLDHLLVRAPMLPAEQLVVNAYDRVKTVTEVRVRWISSPRSNKMLGHFLVVMQLLVPSDELQKIQEEIKVRVGPTQFEVHIEYLSMKEVLRFVDHPIIMRRTWDWYAAHGYMLPTQEDNT